MGWYADTTYAFEVIDRSALKAFLTKAFEGLRFGPDLAILDTGEEPPPWMEFIGTLIGEDNYPELVEKAHISGGTLGKLFFDHESVALDWSTAGIRGTIEEIPDNDPDNRCLYVISPGGVLKFQGMVTVTYPGAEEYMRKVGIRS